MPHKPLLSIAIPTFNRGSILKLALEGLLPQLLDYKDEIEVIISDNASPDDTQIVIESFVNQFPELTFKLFKQDHNSGYYGNFKKCREMSSGMFFWLLSDNDHILPGVIEQVIPSLREHNCCAIYLHSNKSYKKYDKRMIKFDEINGLHSEYSLMLISSMIMLNNTTNDTQIFNRFNQNDFLGFILFANALRYNRNLIVVEGNIFNQYPTVVSFDIFKAWIEDISACITFLEEENILENKEIHDLVNGFLKRVVIFHVLQYLTYRNILGRSYGDVAQIKKRLESNYNKYEFFNQEILPLFSKLRIQLLIEDFFRRGFRKIIKTIKK